MKKARLISSFYSKTKRLGRFHYLIIIDVDITTIQTRKLMKKIISLYNLGNFQSFNLQKFIFQILKILYMRFSNN
jgi:hypothetical protein